MTARSPSEFVPRTSAGVIDVDEIERRYCATDLIMHGGERRKARRDIADGVLGALITEVRTLRSSGGLKQGDLGEGTDEELQRIREGDRLDTPDVV